MKRVGKLFKIKFMKRKIVNSVMCSILALSLVVVACSKKEAITPTNENAVTSSVTSGQSESNAKVQTCYNPIIINLTVGSACQIGYTGGSTAYLNSKVNGITWKVADNCSGVNTYNFYGVPVVYTIYKRTATSTPGAISSFNTYDTYTKVQTFSSLNANMANYQGGVIFPNNTKCLIIAHQNATVGNSYPNTIYNPIANNFLYTTVGTGALGYAPLSPGNPSPAVYQTFYSSKFFTTGNFLGISCASDI